MPKTPNEEDEFFEDLDKSKIKKSCCTSYTLVIFFALLFLFLAVMAGLIIKEIKTARISLPDASGRIGFSQIDLSNKNPTVELPITEVELTTVLGQGLSGKVDNAEATIDPSKILISGNIKAIYGAKTSIEVLPIVEDAKLFLKITKMKSWSVTMPGILRSSVEKSLNSLMAENLADFYQRYEATDSQLGNGKMIIYGKLK